MHLSPTSKLGYLSFKQYEDACGKKNFRKCHIQQKQLCVFSTYIKKIYIEKYENSCQIRNCYVCNNN